jgi:Ni/Co efflux regulator RcnB
MIRPALALAAALTLAVPMAGLGAAPGKSGGHGNSGGQGNGGAHGQGHEGGAQGQNHDHNSMAGGNQYNGQPCPPGLAKKSPSCVPPGQWKKGDRLPTSWAGHYTGYSNLPDIFRGRYTDRRDRRYVYQNDRVYVVDAASRAIVDILLR